MQQCFDEVERVYDETSGREKKLTREDWSHGSLLITIELLRCSNVAAEVECHLMFQSDKNSNRSTKLRRLRNDLAWCYRIVFGLTILKFDDCVHNSRAVLFSERVINVWNQLPESTDFSSLSLFMRSVCCMDLSHYLHI